MIHYVCDACKRPIRSEDSRYVVRMEVYSAPSESGGPLDADRDELAEIDELLERVGPEEGEPQDDAYQQLRFDLCDECRKSFLLDPLGRRVPQPLDFSQN